MTKEEWFKKYDETLPNWQWFIDEYFPTTMSSLRRYRELGNIIKLRSWLQSIWFELPDNKFNIKENPKGWSDFIYLLDESIE